MREAETINVRAPSNGRTANGVSGVADDLRTLAELQWELGVAEARRIVRSVVVAGASAVVGGLIAVPSGLLLVAGLVAALLTEPWRSLVITGGGGLVLGLAGVGWGLYRLRRMPRPVELRRALEETWQWLGAQLRFRLRFG
jgi:hypothetical protein